MNILVCCKIIPDLDRLSDLDWVIPDHGRIDTAFVRNMINPYDESALELALRLAGQGEGLGLSALTLGGAEADPFLKSLLALRFDPVVRIETRSDWRFCPEGIAAMIGAYVLDERPQDVLLLGRQAGEGDHGKTPLLVAELLGWPCITEVEGIEAAPGGRLRVTSAADDGTLVQVVRPPLVLAVGNVAGTVLRVPTLKSRMETSRRRVEVIPEQAFEPGPTLDRCRQDYRLEGLAALSHRRAGTRVEGADAGALARALMEAGLQQRLADL
jgi:electron transfer flavoprotein alpha/beta subunit